MSHSDCCTGDCNQGRACTAGRDDRILAVLALACVLLAGALAVIA